MPVIHTATAPSVFLDIDALSTLDRLAIIRPDNPPPGIAGFVFSIPEEETVELNSDITDHYVETNVAIQDQVSLKPEIVTVRGFVGELVAIRPSPESITSSGDPLPENRLLTPELTETQIQQDAAETATKEIETQAVVSDQSLYNRYSAKAQVSDSAQSNAFSYFYQLWKGRQTVTVETPWGFFTDMAIQSVRSLQGPATRYSTDFTITFKRIRFANELQFVTGQLAGRVVPQTAPQTQNGVAGKTPVSDETNQSLLHRLLN